MSGKLFPEIQKCCQNNCLNQTWLNHVYICWLLMQAKSSGRNARGSSLWFTYSGENEFCYLLLWITAVPTFFCNLSYLLIVSCRNLSISGKGETIRMYRAFNPSLLSGYRLREKEIDLDVYETLQVYACCFFKDKFLLKIDIKFNHSISK